MKWLIKVRRFLTAQLCRHILFIILLSAFSSPSWAFKFSPCLRVLIVEDEYLSEEPIRWIINQCPLLQTEYRSAVHEHMLLSSILKYIGEDTLERNRRGWKYQYMIKEKWGPHKNHLSSAIIYGVWWNDDPMMTMLFQGWSFIRGVSQFNTNVKARQASYPSRLKDCNRVPAEKHLAHESHYGSLQHLHFMTTLKSNKSTSQQRIDATTEKALSWMKFTYLVATGDYKPDQTLTDEMNIGFSLEYIGLNVCAKPENLKVMSLFLPTNQMTFEERKEKTADVALGSMIHVIQDSWSASHTCRVIQSGESGSLPLAVLKDVRNYEEQYQMHRGVAKHTQQDLYPEWLRSKVVHKKTMYSNDPVEVSAWLLNAVDQHYKWEDVEKYLRKTIFAQSDSLQRTNKQPCLFEKIEDIQRNPLNGAET